MIKFINLLLIIFSVTLNAQDSCTISGMADSYVLALSSQPGFCETYGYEVGKPECLELSEHSYQANHLTLHGLWPNVEMCKHHYGFCGVQAKANHCDYPSLPLSSGVSNELKKLMPSFYYGSCLERHEWNKHGSCQILSADDYFSLAIRLAKEADESALGQYLTTHRGQTVKRSELRNAINQAFGEAQGRKVYLGCTHGILVDIYIQLPAVLSADDSLISLIEKAADESWRDLCGKKIKISHFNRAV